MTVLWPINPATGEPLSIEDAMAAVWVRVSRQPKPDVLYGRSPDAETSRFWGLAPSVENSTQL